MRLTLADDRPGGIGYNPNLADAAFGVHVTYNEHWRGMPEAKRSKWCVNGFSLSWGPGRLAGLHLWELALGSHLLIGRLRLVVPEV